MKRLNSSNSIEIHYSVVNDLFSCTIIIDPHFPAQQIKDPALFFIGFSVL